MAGKSATERLAHWVREFEASSVGAPIVERLKLSVLDAIGCAFLARGSAATSPMIAAQGDLGSGGPCTIIGGTDPAPVAAAVLLNATLIRALDFNDHLAMDPNDGARLGGHPSDVLAVALAVGEWRGSTGAEVLEAALMGYEIFGRAQKLLGRDHSWDHVTVHGLTAPAIAGKLMGFSADMLADALSLGAAHGTTPGVVRRGALSSAKFLAGPMVLHAGTTAALLAAHGATGPRTVFEDAHKGLGLQVYAGVNMADLAAPLGAHPMMEGVTIKAYPGLDTSQAPIAAVVEARKAYGGPSDDIARLNLALTEHPMIRRQVEDLALKTPTNRETADHSLTYLAAIALIEGDVTEEQYARAPWGEPHVKDMMARVTMEMDATWETRAPGAYPCRATITTKSGAVHEAEIAFAPGHARNPMDGDGVIKKYQSAVAASMDDARAAEIISLVADLDKAPSLGPLMKVLAG